MCMLSKEALAALNAALNENSSVSDWPAFQEALAELIGNSDTDADPLEEAATVLPIFLYT